MRCTSPKEARDFYLAMIDSVREDNPDLIPLVMRSLCLRDLYFLLSHVLSTAGLFRLPNLNQQWLYDRVQEVNSSPDGHLDLWAREHFKSTTITFGKSIQDILTDPETTIGIFSHTRPIAKGFLRQIKLEFEGNDLLKSLFPDILWENPRRDSPKWSEDDGIIVRRKTNPKEATVEAHGLVDSQPTSKHFRILNYDDVVTRESVTTPDQIKKVTEAWELSLNLGTDGGSQRYIGTRYHFNDTYRTMLDRGSAIPRIYPATDDGTESGSPVLMSREALEMKRRDMGPYTFGTQMLLNPKADAVMGFKDSWLLYWNRDASYAGMNLYLLVDPANEKKKTSDYTSMWVVALGTDNNYRIVDGVRDRLNLTERTKALFRLHRKYHPTKVGYEQYGIQADIQHIKYVMQQENYYFNIVELGGNTPKADRIKRLIPIFEQGRMLLPTNCPYIDTQGRQHNIIDELVKEEYSGFPVGDHDDMLDCLARILDDDLGATFPIAAERSKYVGGGMQTQTLNETKMFWD